MAMRWPWRTTPRGTAWLLRYHPGGVPGGNALGGAGWFLAGLDCGGGGATAGRHSLRAVREPLGRRGGGVEPNLSDPTPAASGDPSLGRKGEEGVGEAEGLAIRCSLAYVREVHRAAPRIQVEREARGVFVSLVDVCRPVRVPCRGSSWNGWPWRGRWIA